MSCGAPGARCVSNKPIVYPEKTDFAGIVQVLNASNLDFILIGGIAAIAHGTATSTYDVDVVYARDRANIQRLVTALAPHHPYLRGAPPGLPFRWDEQTVRMGLNFTLLTTLGHLDVLGEVAGGGDYEALLPYTEFIHIFDLECRCVTLERLIVLKRAASRPKDFLAVAELEALLEERNKRKGQ